ncbi:MAG: hypothetical protein OEM91_00595 [Hyphomicrobiales bacterium]|nr:hypothetical protein [Hyphomicrobiales bacterium]
MRKLVYFVIMVNLAEFNKVGSDTVALSQNQIEHVPPRERCDFQPATEHFPSQEAPLASRQEAF